MYEMSTAIKKSSSR